MSKCCLDFLRNSFLYSELECERLYNSYSDNDIYKELEKYRDYVIKNYEIIHNEIRTEENLLNTCIESCHRFPREDVFKQLLLYMDQIIIADPLFSFTERKSAFSKGLEGVFDFPSNDVLDRKEISSSINYIREIGILIDFGVVIMLPLSYIHESPQKLPIKYSPTAFSDIIPSAILEYLHSIAKVYNVRHSNKGLEVVMQNSLEPGTSILVEFCDEDSQERQGKSVFQFAEAKVNSLNKETGEFEFGIRVPGSISQEQFNVWVNQSVNQAANRVFNETYKEVVFSQANRCMYLTSSIITDKLLKTVIEKPSIESKLATMALSLDLPVISQLPLTELLSVRTNYGEPFHNFRIELNSRLLRIATISDQSQVQEYIDQVAYEMTNTQVKEVEKEYRKISKTLKLDLIALSGSLIATFISGGITSIGAAASLLKSMSDAGKYYTNVHEHNGYFLWRLHDKARKYQI